MPYLLRELDVLVLDCQTSGSTPAHGDLLDLGWARCSPAGAIMATSRWIVPRSGRPIPKPVRELTGWSEACLEEAVAESEAWLALASTAEDMTAPASAIPTVIHYARFELPFLRDLAERHAPGAAFPFDVICAQAIATRLFPDLPKHNIRALSGFLGHSPEQLRRARGHAEATAFIWQALLPHLEQRAIHTWEDAKAWLAEKQPREKTGKRTFALGAEQRRQLPDQPGVYRFLRRNGEVVYVGKATSLKKRVATHFKTRGPASERSLELVSQVHEVEHIVTASLLEAALLESDEIKRLDPPYNVQLRAGERRAWFASRDLERAVATPDELHPLGPLPSERALSALHACVALLESGEASPRVIAPLLAVPATFLPELSLFLEGFRPFAAELERTPGSNARQRAERLSQALWQERAGAPAEPEIAESAPNEWDLARVGRRVERNLIQAGLLLRRARFLCLLADANVAFRERSAKNARGFVIEAARLGTGLELAGVRELEGLPRRRPAPRLTRQRAFDAAAYDRLRVLVTELKRIESEGGEVAFAIGRHLFFDAAAKALMRFI